MIAPSANLASDLYHAPFVLLSHGIQPEPVFCYANLAAQRLWNMDWEKFITLPSRLSAEADARQERERLLAAAAKQGFVDDYRGIRITSDGRRFRINNCILWNVMDTVHDKIGSTKIGQAATFSDWEWL